MHRADSQVHRDQLVGGERVEHRRLQGVGLGPEGREHADARGPRRAGSPQGGDDHVDLGPHDAVVVAPPCTRTTSMQSRRCETGVRVATENSPS